MLDLFSGCGGLTVGFVRAGAESVGAVELDPHAIRSYGDNFHEGSSSHAIPRDINATTPESLLREFGFPDPLQAVDVVVGGPPCPAFTRIGRAKLREVLEHPHAHLHDPRARLYLPYLKYVRALRPLGVLMENVPDILNWSGHNVAEEIADELENLGYRCSYTLLNAASYGVPQLRERFFLVATHRDVNDAVFSFPKPICSVSFPIGYRGARSVALRPLRDMSLLVPSTRYVESPQSENAPGPVSVDEAIGDLPPITGHLNGTLRRGARRFDTAVEYITTKPLSDFARLMREWPSFRSEGMVWDHAIRSLSRRDYRLFRKMKPGDDYPRAHELALSLFERALVRARTHGKVVPDGSDIWKEMRRGYVPPYDVGKFPNKWRKMESEHPARTLMAHLGKDSYSHIHPDSNQARVISVREAARLQSFPDGFQFAGTMNPALRQIGNAVPPILAWALADTLLPAIGWKPRSGAPRWRPALRKVVARERPTTRLARHN